MYTSLMLLRLSVVVPVKHCLFSGLVAHVLQWVAVRFNPSRHKKTHNCVKFDMHVCSQTLIVLQL